MADLATIARKASNDNDDYDGHRFFRGCLIAAPFSLLLWILIIMAVLWFTS